MFSYKYTCIESSENMRGKCIGFYKIYLSKVVNYFYNKLEDQIKEKVKLKILKIFRDGE